jgi:co-chaperonin GroES (HSP10)
MANTTMANTTMANTTMANTLIPNIPNDTEYYLSQINTDKSNGYIVFENINPQTIESTPTTDPNINIKYIKTTNNNKSQKITIKNIEQIESKKVFVKFLLDVKNDNNNEELPLIKVGDTVIMSYLTNNKFKVDNDTINITPMTPNNLYNITISFSFTSTNINIDYQINNNKNILTISKPNNFDIMELLLNDIYNIGGIIINVLPNTNNTFFNTISNTYSSLFTLIPNNTQVVTTTTTTPVETPQTTKSNIKYVDKKYIPGTVKFGFEMPEIYNYSGKNINFGIQDINETYKNIENDMEQKFKILNLFNNLI